MSNPALLIQPKVGVLRKIGYAPFRKKLGGDALFSRLVSDMLRAFFTEFKMRTLAVGLRPGAARTIDAVLLIELQQRARATDDAHLAPGKLRRDQRGLGAT